MGQGDVIPHVSVASRGRCGGPENIHIKCCMRWILTQSEGLNSHYTPDVDIH